MREEKISAEVRLKQEYIQFAALCSMSRGTEGTIEYRQRFALWRARKLQSLQFSNPVLRQAALKFIPIAILYELSHKLRNRSRVTKEELDGFMEELRKAPKDDEATKNVTQYLTLGTLNKLALIEAADQYENLATAGHSRLWQEVLPLTERFGGPDNSTFPLRVGALWVGNVSGRPLHNLTIAIQTNASTKLPANACLHVIFFEGLDPNQWDNLPTWLIDKAWVGGRWVAMKNCFRCSIWSDEVCFKDVVFDLRILDPRRTAPGVAPDKALTLGCFPNNTFRGNYDTTTPWTYLRPSYGELFPSIGEWIGQDNSTHEPCRLVIMEVIGPNFHGMYRTGTPEIAGPLFGKHLEFPRTLMVEGSFGNGKIEWEPVVMNPRLLPSQPDDDGTEEQANSGRPSPGGLGPPHWGTIKGNRIEVHYGNKRVSEGTISLEFVEPKRPKS